MELQNGRPADVSGRLAREVRVYDYLDGLGIPYQRTDHGPAGTMEQCNAIDAVLGVIICKFCFCATGRRRRITF